MLIAGALVSCSGRAPEQTTGSRESSTAQPQTTQAPDSGEVPEGGETADVVTDGVGYYTIVAYRGTNEALLNAPAQIQKRVQLLTGVTLPIVEPGMLQDAERLIVIGEATAFPETVRATAELDIGLYGYAVEGRLLMLLGHSEAQLERAVSKFLGVLNESAVKNGTVTDLRLPLASERSCFRYDNWLIGAPRVEKSYSSVYDCGDSTYLLAYRNAGAEVLEELKGKLEASAYRLSQTAEIGDNRYGTYTTQEGEISYSYRVSGRFLRVVYQSYRDRIAAIPSVGPESGYRKLTETKMTLLPLNYAASCADPTDCSGLSSVVTLEDGRFLIVDGGYKDDADALYRYLSDHNLRQDGIEIAAWVLTHGHGDHIGCFDAFSARYGSEVRCSYLISNALPATTTPTNNEANDSILLRLEAVASRFAGNTQILKLHEGQSVWFCNTELQMLFTHESLFPTRPDYLNETSLVFRVRTGGQTVLFTADSELQSVTMLMSVFGTELKADILQLNHHGFTAIDPRFFDLVSPETVLWPSSQATVDVRKTESWRDGVYAYLLRLAKVCYVADGDAMILTLPYHAGDKTEFYHMNFQKRETT